MIERVEKDEDYWLEWNMQNWRIWQISGGRPDGLPGIAAGGMCAEHSDFDDMCQQMDVNLAITTEAVISDLSPVEQCAIHRKYLTAVYRFRELYHVVLERSLSKIKDGLRLKGVWLGK